MKDSLCHLLLALLASQAIAAEDVNIMLMPETLTVDEGEDANFTCSPLLREGSSILNSQAPGDTQPEGFTNGDPRIRVTDDLELDAESGERIFTWLNASRADDGRIFFCLFGEFTSNVATLRVRFEPSIMIGETEFLLMAGETLNVSFSVSGYPMPDLGWALDGETITSTPERTLSSSGLLVQSAGLGDAGTYMVTASNVVGSATVTFTVTVRSGPVFEVADDTKLSARAGEEVVINCQAYAYPAIQNITLTLNGEELTLEADNTYTIPSVQTGDAGTYMCTAKNEISEEILEISVEVGGVPGTVGDIKVRVEEKMLLIEWAAADDNGVAILHYSVTIEYGEEAKSYMESETRVMIPLEELKVSTRESELRVRVTVTAVNGIGSGVPVTYEGSVKIEELTKDSSGLSLPQTLPTLLIVVMCTVLALL